MKFNDMVKKQRYGFKKEVELDDIDFLWEIIRESFDYPVGIKVEDCGNKFVINLPHDEDEILEFKEKLEDMGYEVDYYDEEWLDVYY